MDRLTEKRDGHNVIPLRKFGIENIPKFTLVEISDNTSFLYGDFANKLAAYEDTGLTPEEITAMKAEYSDTFQAHLNQLLGINDKQIAVLQALCEDMENTAKEYRAFKEFFDALYGCGLTVGNYHLNGALEPFDNFYDKAVDEMRKERASNGRNG